MEAVLDLIHHQVLVLQGLIMEAEEVVAKETEVMEVQVLQEHV